MKSIFVILLVFNYCVHAADQKAFIQSCVDAYNNSNQAEWYKCWDEEGVQKIWAKQAKKNGMTVEQMKTLGFQQMRSGSGKVVLKKLIQDCEDDSLKKFAAMGAKKGIKGAEKFNSIPTPHHYYYEASSEKKGKLGLRFDIINKSGVAKIMTYNYLICSENPDCTNHDSCPAKK